MPLITHAVDREMLAVIQFSPKNVYALQNRNVFGLSGEVKFLRMLMNVAFENFTKLNSLM